MGPDRRADRGPPTVGARRGPAADQLISQTEGVVAVRARGGVQCGWRDTPAHLALARSGRRRVGAREPAIALRFGVAAGPPRPGRAPDRTGRAPRPRASTSGAGCPARRRPPLHRARLPAGDARGRWHPAGRLRAGAVAALHRRLGDVDRDRRPGPEFDLARRDRVSVSVRAAAGPAASPPALRPDPGGAASPYLRCTGLPALLPEWAYGHWKSRDVYEHEATCSTTSTAIAPPIPLDAIVIDSPWETQYNTWQFNPQQFPDPPGWSTGCAARACGPSSG